MVCHFPGLHFLPLLAVPSLPGPAFQSTPTGYQLDFTNSSALHKKRTEVSKVKTAWIASSWFAAAANVADWPHLSTGDQVPHAWLVSFTAVTTDWPRSISHTKTSHASVTSSSWLALSAMLRYGNGQPSVIQQQQTELYYYLRETLRVHNIVLQMCKKW